MNLDSKTIIVTHQLYYGAAQALRDYLIKNKAKELFFLGLPFFNRRSTYVELYKKGRKVKVTSYPRKIQLGIFDYILDVVSTIIFIFQQRQRYDYYVGAGTLDCFTGIVLKKIGFVRNVIFYSIDFVPKRFNNTLLNNFFHGTEIFCVKNSDFIWNVSPRIAEGRKKFLHLSDKKYKQEVVPIGVWNDHIKKRKFSEVKKHQVLFMGHLLQKQGVQLVLEAIPLISKKIPDFKLLVVGGGEYKDALVEKVETLNIRKYVTFTGWIEERNKIDTIIGESVCAVATYMPEKERLSNFTYYADPTKLKDYLSAGLPVILTDVSYNAKEIHKRKCGILVEYKKEAIAKAIISLLKNELRLQQYRENALTMAKEFDWEIIFNKVMKNG